MATLDASQGNVLALANFPSEEAEASQAVVLAETQSTNEIEASQGYVLALVAGRTQDPSVRAWTFSLDGHDFYVLRLGNEETLVYDVTTGQWHVWGTGEENIWSAFTGINWVGSEKLSSGYGSNVLVGSDSNGSLFLLDPNRDTDDSQIADDTTTYPFTRRITVQVPTRGYDRASVYEVQLLGSIGDLSNEELNTITLSYSDDRGKTYTDAGTVTIENEDYDGRATWRSLGSLRSPGRIFRIEDTGSLRRIDNMTMNSDLG